MKVKPHKIQPCAACAPLVNKLREEALDRAASYIDMMEALAEAEDKLAAHGLLDRRNRAGKDSAPTGGQSDLAGEGTA